MKLPLWVHYSYYIILIYEYYSLSSHIYTLGIYTHEYTDQYMNPLGENIYRTFKKSSWYQQVCMGFLFCLKLKTIYVIINVLIKHKKCIMSTTISQVHTLLHKWLEHCSNELEHDHYPLLFAYSVRLFASYARSSKNLRLMLCATELWHSHNTDFIQWITTQVNSIY